MARKTTKRTGLEGIEPHTMSLPAMDRVSVTFALMLDGFKVERDDEGERLLMVCDYCTEGLFVIEPGDSLRVMFNTALAHTCE